MEVVARPLDGQGEPARTDTTPGRFMAEFRGFVDPAVYAEGRRLTVVGTLGGIAERAIGDYAYRFPVVAVEHHYLWPAEKPRRDPYPPPWYHDPWYPYHSPYYPYW
jgi:outer membrane lipoprotein